MEKLSMEKLLFLIAPGFHAVMLAKLGRNGQTLLTGAVYVSCLKKRDYISRSKKMLKRQKNKTTVDVTKTKNASSSTDFARSIQ